MLLLEKKRFTRDKHYGYAVMKTGIEILHEMGLYEKLLASEQVQSCECKDSNAEMEIVIALICMCCKAACTIIDISNHTKFLVTLIPMIIIDYVKHRSVR